MGIKSIFSLYRKGIFYKVKKDLFGRAKKLFALPHKYRNYLRLGKIFSTSSWGLGIT